MSIARLTTCWSATLLGTLLCNPAVADTTLFEFEGQQLMCPHGWSVTVDNMMAILEPQDAAANPGSPRVVLFSGNYQFPWFYFPGDAVTAAFEHLSATSYVVERQVYEEQLLDVGYLVVVEGSLDEDGDYSTVESYVATVRIAANEDAEDGYFGFVRGETRQALMLGSSVLGVVGAGLLLPLVDSPDLRAYRLPEAAE